MYDRKQLQEDAQGYGRVLYVAQGPDLLTTDPQYPATKPHAAFSTEQENFINRLYAFVRTERRITVYRAHGDERTASARMLARYWSPIRPALAIDRLGYASHHNTLRHDQAVLRGWNPLSQVVEAELAAGSEIFIGRTAAKATHAESYRGGSIQFFLNTRDADGLFAVGLPAISHQLTLKRNHRVGG
jgi:hypothetical protein